MKKIVRAVSVLVVLGLLLTLLGAVTEFTPTVQAANPGSGTLSAPSDHNGTSTVSWSGGPYTIATPDKAACLSATLNCDTFQLSLNLAQDYWVTHLGFVTIEINWAS